MVQFIQHPKYGRILSHEGWLNNDKNKTCSFCGNTIVTPGFCSFHYEDFKDNRHVLDDIIKFRNDNKAYEPTQ